MFIILYFILYLHSIETPDIVNVRKTPDIPNVRKTPAEIH